MSSFFDASTDPLSVLGQDPSAQRAQLAQYAILRASTMMSESRNDEALTAFKQALAFEPTNTTANTYIAKINLAKGNTYEAIKAYKAILQITPTSSEAHTNLANAYIQAKDFTNSEKELKTAAKLDPSDPLPVYTLGHQYMQLGRYSEAETAFNKVKTISPNDGNVYYSLGTVYNKEGQYDKAITVLKKALALKSDFSAANYELGYAYNAVGNTDEAQKQLKILQKAGASESSDLQYLLENPTIEYMDQSASKNFNQILGAGTPLWMLDPSLLSPNSSSKMTVAIQFSNKMDVASVMDASNWEISKANDASGGFYITKLDGSDTAIPRIPLFVTYDPTTMQAKVTFAVQQNAAGNATIDPSHIVFKFSGKDALGRSMDTSADQIEGAKTTGF